MKNFICCTTHAIRYDYDIREDGLDSPTGHVICRRIKEMHTKHQSERKEIFGTATCRNADNI